MSLPCGPEAEAVEFVLVLFPELDPLPDPLPYPVAEVLAAAVVLLLFADPPPPMVL